MRCASSSSSSPNRPPANSFPQSKQYLTLHTVDQGAPLKTNPSIQTRSPSFHHVSDNFPAHPAEIFSLAPTPTSLISASGSSSLRIHSTVDANFPLIHTIQDAHKLGCHHVATAKGGLGNVAASVGFGGEIKIWKKKTSEKNDEFALDWEIKPTKTSGGDVWAVALSANEEYLAYTTSDGRIHVWDLTAKELIQTYETGARGGGSFSMSVDLSRDGKFTASGHESGAVYVFNNDAGRMVYSLSGGFLHPCGPWLTITDGRWCWR